MTEVELFGVEIDDQSISLIREAILQTLLFENKTGDVTVLLTTEDQIQCVLVSFRFVRHHRSIRNYFADLLNLDLAPELALVIVLAGDGDDVRVNALFRFAAVAASAAGAHIAAAQHRLRKLARGSITVLGIGDDDICVRELLRQKHFAPSLLQKTIVLFYLFLSPSSRDFVSQHIIVVQIAA